MSAHIWDTLLSKLNEDPLSELFFYGTSEKLFLNHGKKSVNLRFAINHLLFEETCDAENAIDCKNYVASQVASQFGIQDTVEFSDYSLQHILCGSSFCGLLEFLLGGFYRFNIAKRESDNVSILQLFIHEVKVVQEVELESIKCIGSICPDISEKQIHFLNNTDLSLSISQNLNSKKDLLAKLHFKQYASDYVQRLHLPSHYLNVFKPIQEQLAEMNVNLNEVGTMQKPELNHSGHVQKPSKRWQSEGKQSEIDIIEAKRPKIAIFKWNKEITEFTKESFHEIYGAAELTLPISQLFTYSSEMQIPIKFNCTETKNEETGETIIKAECCLGPPKNFQLTGIGNSKKTSKEVACMAMLKYITLTTGDFNSEWLEAEEHQTKIVNSLGQHDPTRSLTGLGNSKSGEVYKKDDPEINTNVSNCTGMVAQGLKDWSRESYNVDNVLYLINHTLWNQVFNKESKPEYNFMDNKYSNSVMNFEGNGQMFDGDQRLICSLEYLDISAQAYGSHKDKAKRAAGLAWVMAYLDEHGEDSIEKMVTKLDLKPAYRNLDTVTPLQDSVDNWKFDQEGNLLMVTEPPKAHARPGKRKRMRNQECKKQRLEELAAKGFMTAKVELDEINKKDGEQENDKGYMPLWERVPDWDDADLIGM